MSELTVGTISGLAANGYVVDVASGSLLTQPGMVLQVVNAINNSNSNTSSTSYVASLLSASITPSSTSSKILIMYSGNVNRSGNANSSVGVTIYRGGVASGIDLNPAASMSGIFDANSSTTSGAVAITFLDSPSTISSVTYEVAFKTNNSSFLATMQPLQSLTLIEVAG